MLYLSSSVAAFIKIMSEFISGIQAENPGNRCAIYNLLRISRLEVLSASSF